MRKEYYSLGFLSILDVYVKIATSKTYFSSKKLTTFVFNTVESNQARFGQNRNILTNTERNNLIRFGFYCKFRHWPTLKPNLSTQGNIWEILSIVFCIASSRSVEVTEFRKNQIQFSGKRENIFQEVKIFLENASLWPFFGQLMCYAKIWMKQVHKE